MLEEILGCIVFAWTGTFRGQCSGSLLFNLRKSCLSILRCEWADACLLCLPYAALWTSVMRQWVPLGMIC